MNTYLYFMYTILGKQIRDEKPQSKKHYISDLVLIKFKFILALIEKISSIDLIDKFVNQQIILLRQIYDITQHQENEKRIEFYQDSFFKCKNFIIIRYYMN